jgi:phage terminase large subunit
MKPYPDPNHFDSDYDYYLAKINYSQASVQAHYDELKKKAIKSLEELSEQALGIAESFNFEYGSIYKDLEECIDEIQRILDEAEPTKCIEL